MNFSVCMYACMHVLYVSSDPVNVTSKFRVYVQHTCTHHDVSKRRYSKHTVSKPLSWYRHENGVTLQEN